MPILQPADARAEDLGVLGGAPFLAGMPPFASKLLPLKQAHALYRRACSRSGSSILEKLLSEMDIDLQVEAADLHRIPKTGPSS